MVYAKSLYRIGGQDYCRHHITSAEPAYAITLHQPWASLIALGIKTVETRSWPAGLVGRRIAVHAGKRLVRRPGDAIERELRARCEDDWRVIIPTGAVLATVVLAGIVRVSHIGPSSGHAVHDLGTEIGYEVEIGRTVVKMVDYSYKPIVSHL